MEKLPYIIGIALSALLFGCREQYTPPVITTPSNYLVVEGLINTGTDSTIIKLSRTVNLNAKVTIKAETKAKITVEGDANASYPLKEIKAGTYASTPLGLDSTAKYRLRIITNDGKVYLSDFTAVTESPPIDSLGYKVQPDGLQIYANARNARYYRWEFVETWKFHAALRSGYIAIYPAIVTRTSAQDIYYCWTSAASTDIVLGAGAACVDCSLRGSLKKPYFWPN